MVMALTVILFTTDKPWFIGKEVGGGILLGAFNLGSLYFFIQALNHSGLESSIVFGIHSTGIVFLSAGAGFLIFKESLSWINTMGLALAIIALFILYFLLPV